MVKFTDSFFSFPIRIYDGDSMEKHLRVSEMLEQNIEPEWVVGIMKVPAQWFVDDKINWVDSYSRGRGVEDVEREGFDTTHVDIDGSLYCCVWERRKFEDKLNEFMERYSSKILKEIKEQEIDNE